MRKDILEQLFYLTLHIYTALVPSNVMQLEASELIFTCFDTSQHIFGFFF